MEEATSDLKLDAEVNKLVRDGIAVEVDHFEATALNRIETYKRRYKRELVGLKMIVEAELMRLEPDHDNKTFEPSPIA